MRDYKFWADEELEALHKLVQLNRCNQDTYRQIFLTRTPGGVRQKLERLQAIDPEKWTPKYKPDINWDHIKVLEKEAEQCEKSRSSVIPIAEVVSR